MKRKIINILLITSFIFIIYFYYDTLHLNTTITETEDEEDQFNNTDTSIESKSYLTPNTASFNTSNTSDLKVDIFNALKQYTKINSDVIGYIYIPNSNINYPVLLSTDNNYYLSHNYNKELDSSGCVFADSIYKQSNISEEFQVHTILYGHNLLNKTMFSSIAKYTNGHYYHEHPYIFYGNLKEVKKWKVFSVYVIDANSESIKRTYCKNKEFINYLTSIKSRSIYKSNVNLSVNSKILTLCTCSYESDNSRTIVHAVLNEDD